MIEYISEMSKYDQIFYTLEYMIESGDILIDNAFIINEKAFEKFARAKEEIKDLGYDLKDCAVNIKDYLNGKSRERDIVKIASSLKDGTPTRERIKRLENYAAFENFIRETAFKHGCKKTASPKEIIQFYNKLVMDGKISPQEKQTYITNQVDGPESVFRKNRELRNLDTASGRLKNKQSSSDKIMSKIKHKIEPKPIKQLT